MDPQNFQNPSPDQAPQAPISPQPPSQPKSPLAWLLGIAVILIFAIIVGYWWLSRGTGVVVPPPAPEDSPRDELSRGESSGNQTTNNVPADWQTYRNEEYGFEFMYPAEFKYKSGISIATYDLNELDRGRTSAPEENKIEVVSLHNPQQLALTTFVSSELENEDPLGPLGFPIEVSKEMVITPDLSGIKLDFGSLQNSYYLSSKQKPELVLLFNIYGDATNFGLLDQILSTFKFIE